MEEKDRERETERQTERERERERSTMVLLYTKPFLSLIN